MIFLSENFRRQHETSKSQKDKPKFVSSIPVQETHIGAGLIVTLISGMIAGTILLSNAKSLPTILLSLTVFVVLNIAGRFLLWA